MSIVNSHNEWDQLEEVIVGTPEGAIIPSWDRIDYACNGNTAKGESFLKQGNLFPKELISNSIEDVENFIYLLKKEGVEVRRPLPFTCENLSYSTPDWSWNKGGFNFSNPRDIMLVVGATVIEAPTNRKNRIYEVNAYKKHLKEFSESGAKWISAPKPQLTEQSFQTVSSRTGSSLILESSNQIEYPHTEYEPVFEAADFMKCGKDIFYQLSYVTNRSGVRWLENFLGPDYTLHEIKSKCRRPLHLDTTFIPLAPGKALVNPDFVDKLPPVLDKWEIKIAPIPIKNPDRSSFQFGSDWLSMNLFSLDHQRVFVEQRQKPLIALLKNWGFHPIPISFESYYVLGGGLHCSTLDVRRAGKLKKYF